MTPTALARTTLWAEVLAAPASVRATLAASEGFDDLAGLLRSATRIVATGNGAAYYVAHWLWLASLHGRRHAEVAAVPAGLLARGAFRFRPGDVLLAVSSSGQLRDAIEALDAGAPRPYGAITSTPGSPIGLGAGAVARVAVASQEAVTHTQAYLGNLAAAAAVWARLDGDAALLEALDELPDALVSAVAETGRWIEGAAEASGDPAAAVSFGSRFAWTAALETSLLLKEVTRIPAEGMETREGATSGMYALGPEQLVVSLPTGADPLLEEAESTCAGTGATVVRVPGGDLGDPRLAPLTLFPGTVALAVALGLRSGQDVDQPGWVDAYYATARAGQTEG